MLSTLESMTHLCVQDNTLTPHSQTSLLVSSHLSLGIPLTHSTQCERFLDSQTLVWVSRMGDPRGRSFVSFAWISTILYTPRVLESQGTCITWDIWNDVNPLSTITVLLHPCYSTFRVPILHLWSLDVTSLTVTMTHWVLDLPTRHKSITESICWWPQLETRDWQPEEDVSEYLQSYCVGSGVWKKIDRKWRTFRRDRRQPT